MRNNFPCKITPNCFFWIDKLMKGWCFCDNYTIIKQLLSRINYLYVVLKTTTYFQSKRFKKRNRNDLFLISFIWIMNAPCTALYLCVQCTMYIDTNYEHFHIISYHDWNLDNSFGLFDLFSQFKSLFHYSIRFNYDYDVVFVTNIFLLTFLFRSVSWQYFLLIISISENYVGKKKRTNSIGMGVRRISFFKI